MEELIGKLFRQKNKTPVSGNIQTSHGDDIEIPASWLERHSEVPKGLKIKRGPNLASAILERLNAKIGRITKGEPQHKTSQGEHRP